MCAKAGACTARNQAIKIRATQAAQRTSKIGASSFGKSKNNTPVLKQSRCDTNTVLGAENGALGSSTNNTHVALKGGAIAVTPDQKLAATNMLKSKPLLSATTDNSDLGMRVMFRQDSIAQLRENPALAGRRD